MEFYNNNTLFYIEKYTGFATPNDDHFRNLYEFNYIKKGNTAYIINNEMYNLTSGDVVVMPPNTLHKSIQTTNEVREKIIFYLDRDYLSTFLDSRMSLPVTPTIYHVSDTKRIAEIFEELNKEFYGQSQRVYMEILIGELIVLLHRTEKKMTTAHKSSGIITDILQYIKEQYKSDITLKDTANKFYLNPSYLSRFFKEQTGFTFYQYITKLRIKDANKLLSLTDKSITEIAFLCGFNSSNNFCKAYKKIMGISALEYKRLSKSVT